MSKYQTTIIFKIDKTYKHHDLEVVVDRAGDILSAVAYSSILDEWLDCTEIIRSSNLWRLRVQEEFSGYDWAEHVAQERYGA